MIKGCDSERSPEVAQKAYRNQSVESVQAWFKQHVTLSGKPYTLDFDQAKAVTDNHLNTLVTARAGSGKTRVIVAKVAYLLAHQLANLEEIMIFMFNRTAAVEVNQRIAEVEIDGVALAEPGTVSIASTFHKFALTVVQSSGRRPEILSETEQADLIARLLNDVITELSLKLGPKETRELLGIVSNFITRAGQKFPGRACLKTLDQAVDSYLEAHRSDPAYAKQLLFHQVSAKVYARYLEQLTSPKIDFNLLMSEATEILSKANQGITSAKLRPLVSRLSRIKYLMIDEYQDFSFLFFALVSALRALTLRAHLLAVGDDWQAINRFAGSDVNYFIHFADFFPEDTTNIPLATNYRSNRRIVERANQFMLTHYDPSATPAKAFSTKSGKIYLQNPERIYFQADDWREDGLGDARYQLALKEALNLSPSSPEDLAEIMRKLLLAAKFLKSIVKIIKKHAYADIMLLHRHNFTSYPGVTLEVLERALRQVLIEQEIMDKTGFDRQIRFLTMHRSKGLESDVVILLEAERDIVYANHPHATIFELFGDTLEAERADQQRLLYVALTRAKHRLYILTRDSEPLF